MPREGLSIHWYTNDNFELSMNTIEITFNDKHCLTKELIEISMNTKNTMLCIYYRKYLVLTYKNLDTYLVNTKVKTNEVQWYSLSPLCIPPTRGQTLPSREVPFSFLSIQ